SSRAACELGGAGAGRVDVGEHRAVEAGHVPVAGRLEAGGELVLKSEEAKCGADAAPLPAPRPLRIRPCHPPHDMSSIQSSKMTIIIQDFSEALTPTHTSVSLLPRAR